MSADWQSLYPFQSHHLAIGAWRMHYVDEGDGPPLLFVHGNPTWSFYWRNLVTAFRETHRCVAVDHIGCGLSDKPAEFSYRLADHIANLVQVIDELDLTDITLAVHDWGGAIGLGAALQRVSKISRIVLFNTGAFPPPYVPLRIRMCRFPLLGRLAVQGLNGFARAAIHMATEKPQRMTPEVKAGLLAPYDNWNNRRATYQFVADIPLTRRHPTWQTLADIEAGLRRLAHLPVQIHWGMKDWCFRPECLDRFRQAFPHAEVQEIEDAGHYVVEDAHERIIPPLRSFLATESIATTPH